MSVSNNKYVYGSVAENIKSEVYDPYEENTVLKSKKIARSNAKVKTKIVFIIFMIFSMCGIIMFRYAQISQLNYQSNQLTKQYTELQNENSNAALEINNAMSLSKIIDVAENKLGMHKPNKSQIIYVEVPTKDVTILASKEKSKIAETFENIGDGVKNFLNVFNWAVYGDKRI